MIDPKAITNFSRTKEELEEFLMFAIVVAGKSSAQQAVKLDRFIKDIGGTFDVMRKMTQNEIRSHLETVRMGQYTRISKAFFKIIHLDLTNALLEEIEAAVGPKTARFFLLHSRPNQNVAVLDTHILKYMREKGISAPKQTPSNYRKFEVLFLDLFKSFGAGLSLAEFDLKIWSERAI